MKPFLNYTFVMLSILIILYRILFSFKSIFSSLFIAISSFKFFNLSFLVNELSFNVFSNLSSFKISISIPISLNASTKLSLASLKLFTESIFSLLVKNALYFYNIMYCGYISLISFFSSLSIKSLRR